MIRQMVESKLKHLYIVQNENTPKTVMPCSARAWLHFKRHTGDRLRVNLVANSKGKIECDFLIQPEAPVYSITCQNVWIILRFFFFYKCCFNFILNHLYYYFYSR